jgi:hypothetical protein
LRRTSTASNACSRACANATPNALTISALAIVLVELADAAAAGLHGAGIPGLEFNLQTSVALVDFEREPVDAAMRLGGGQWQGLTAEHLFDEWIVPMASPEAARPPAPARSPTRWAAGR